MMIIKVFFVCIYLECLGFILNLFVFYMFLNFLKNVLECILNGLYLYGFFNNMFIGLVYN